MKKQLLLILAICASCFAQAQGCVDSTLINPNALCPLIWAPVCGCDGNTYANECEAVNYGGVTSFTPGECIQIGCQNLSGVDFGFCDMFLGYAWTDAGCSGLSGCGYLVDEVDYSPYFFANLEDCISNCGGGDCFSQQQVDEGALVLCADIYEPVCGCDGITYSNECMAYYSGGNTLISIGGCDGQLDYCPRIPASAQFGDCAMPLGWALTTSGCVEMSGCSYIGSNGYDYSAFFFNSSYECNNNCLQEVVIDCIDSTQIDISIMCPAIYDPVCGCDSITYSNSCEALYHHGVMFYTPGECTTSISDLNADGIQIGPNPSFEYIRLNITNFQPGTLQIYTTSGGLALGPLAIKTNLQTVQLNDLSDGLYIIEWIGNDQRHIRTRMIKSSR
jgi:Kazal-type serine protease inhibitor domain